MARPQAIVCADPFHLVQLVGKALDEVRRDLWQQLRRVPVDRWARDIKVARWALLKNAEDLTDNQADQLAGIRRNRGGLWRAYEMKVQFGHPRRRPHPERAALLLDRRRARAQRSRLEPLVKCARTMRERRDRILNTIHHGTSNGQVEGMNTKVRPIVRRAYGFHSADAALALVMLAAGPINLQLPQKQHWSNRAAA